MKRKFIKIWFSTRLSPEQRNFSVYTDRWVIFIQFEAKPIPTKCVEFLMSFILHLSAVKYYALVIMFDYTLIII